MKENSTKNIQILWEILFFFALPTRDIPHSNTLVMNFRRIMLLSISHATDKVMENKQIRAIEKKTPVTIPSLKLKIMLYLMNYSM